MGEHAEFADRHPFNEVIPVLREIMADGVIDEEERADILYICSQLNTDNTYFCEITSDMQRLQGMISGVLADGRVTKEELQTLQEWMDDHEHLRRCWPYDEIEALITAVLADGRIDETEHDQLIAFFGEFAAVPGHRAISQPTEHKERLISGVCAICPEIELPERVFCFTGQSKRCNRDQMEELIVSRGGRFSKGVIMDLDYLIIGAAGNPCWAFACYGRKVESAVEYRKKGCKLLLVHENDFWDAIG